MRSDNTQNNVYDLSRETSRTGEISTTRAWSACRPMRHPLIKKTWQRHARPPQKQMQFPSSHQVISRPNTVSGSSSTSLKRKFRNYPSWWPPRLSGTRRSEGRGDVGGRFRAGSCDCKDAHRTSGGRLLPICRQGRRVRLMLGFGCRCRDDQGRGIVMVVRVSCSQSRLPWSPISSRLAQL